MDPPRCLGSCHGRKCARCTRHFCKGRKTFSLATLPGFQLCLCKNRGIPERKAYTHVQCEFFMTWEFPQEVKTLRNIFLFFLRFYLFMRDTERGRDTGRGRSRLPVGSLMWDLIPGPQDHDLSRRQMLNHWATQVSQNTFVLSLMKSGQSCTEVIRQRGMSWVW